MPPEKCPGYLGKEIKIEIHKCPGCGYEVEIFTDEVKRKCPQCGTEVLREMTPTCALWCKYAAQCIGEEKLKEIMETLKKKDSSPK